MAKWRHFEVDACWSWILIPTPCSRSGAPSGQIDDCETYLHLSSMASMLRHDIIAEFRTEQLSLDPAAIKLIQTRLDQSNAGRDMVIAVVAAVKEAMGSAGKPSAVCEQVTAGSVM